jgi:very-short-patch-repair endonuclease
MNIQERIPLDQFARSLRDNPTKSEAAVWEYLQPEGFTFQQIIGPFVVDFFHDGARLIVEIDGPSHDGKRWADAAREETLTGYGFTVLRFSDKHALSAPDRVAGIAAAHVQLHETVARLQVPFTTSRKVYRYARMEAGLTPRQMERVCKSAGIDFNKLRAERK